MWWCRSVVNEEILRFGMVLASDPRIQAVVRENLQHLNGDDEEEEGQGEATPRPGRGPSLFSLGREEEGEEEANSSSHRSSVSQGAGRGGEGGREGGRG